jgi:SNF2 family DNA or RNA helicase
MSPLDPVQLAALDFSQGKFGVGWFMEQGLGKSLTALAEFAYLYERNKADRMVIICPNTFKNGWVDEIEKHGFNFDVHVFRSSKKEAAGVWLRQNHNAAPVLIVNYEAVRLPNVMKALVVWCKMGRAYLAIDESIQIKGNKSSQTKAVHQIAAWSKFTGEPIVARWVRLLTGRPQTQGPQDLWGQLRAIGLFLDTNFYNFRGLFCVMGGWQFKEVIAPKNAEGLAKAMASNVFQAKKIDWLPGLPRKDYSILDYQMSGEQKHQYKQMEEQFLLDIESGTVTVEVAIAKFAKLAQIQTGFIYDGEKIAHELVAPEDNPRLQLLLDLLEEEEGKVCVVYRHRPILPFLQRALAKWDPAYIAGQMKPDEVTEQKRRFNDEPSCRIILLQCDAAKYGHTLLGGSSPIDKCRDMIFFENSYSADTRDQIEDRIHRRGQTGERVHYRDLSGSDLDRRIVKALQRKDALYKSVFKNLRASKPQDAELERVTP